MQTAIFLSIFALAFGALIYSRIRRVWRMYRVITIVLPGGSDQQAFTYRLTEGIRTLGFREEPPSGPVRVFRGPGWMRWAVGLQDICVEPAENGAFLITGPAFKVSVLGRLYSGAIVRPYQGRQPVWPLCRGLMRLVAVGIGLFAAAFVPFYLFAGH